MFFYEIDDIELDNLAFLISEREEKPLVVPFSVGVILHDKVILFYLALDTEIGVSEVATLEAGVEFMLRFLIMFCGLIVFGVVVGRLSDREYIGYVMEEHTGELLVLICFWVYLFVEFVVLVFIL